MARAIVIFGAALRSDGQPSPSLRRRAHFGALAAQEEPDSWIFCSGGVGRFGGSEASIMRDLLIDRGIDPVRIALDEESKDTLQNVVAAAQFVRSRRLQSAVACTDPYHLPRVQMLFAMLGVASTSGFRNIAGSQTPLHYSVAMSLRECAAYPYDLLIVLRRRRELLRHIEG